jgi:hypothetical protein
MGLKSFLRLNSWDEVEREKKDISDGSISVGLVTAQRWILCNISESPGWFPDYEK